MNFNRPIFWQQGTFLEPQHFQILEWQRRRDLSFLASSFFPYPWGISRLRLSPDALQNFSLSILELELFTPNGRHLMIPDNLKVPSRSFRQSWDKPDQPLPVCLALPLISETEANVEALPSQEGSGPGQGAPDLVADSGQGLVSRPFEAEPDPQAVPDLLAGGPEGHISCLWNKAFLLFGTETGKAPPGTVLVPLARLVREGDRVRQDTAYAPPSLRLYPESPLSEILMGVLELLLAKGRQLEEYKISPAQGQNESQLAGRGLALVTILGIVSRYAARLDALCGAPAVSPWAAYAALRELAAELTIFAPGLSALGQSLSGSGEAGLLPYNHMDAYPAFQRARAFIARLLDSVSPGPELTLVFQQDGKNFSLELPAWLDSSYAFYLSVRSGLSKEEAVRSFAAFAKLSSPAKMAGLISLNLPGIAIIPLPAAPVGLPRRDDTAYFSLGQSDPMWEEAVKARRLALFWDEAPEASFITLSANRS
jgi:type VI secretion system protein ImpJ